MPSAIRLLLVPARTATRQTANRALIRSFISYSGAPFIREPVAYHRTIHPFITGTRSFSMSSSSSQAQQPDPAPIPASAEVSEATSAAETAPQLPPLSPQQFRQYNRLAEAMEYFVCESSHNFFTSDCLMDANMCLSTTTSAKAGKSSTQQPAPVSGQRA